MNIRRVKEGLLEQGEGEEITYTITTTPWGSDPSSPSVVLYDTTDKTDSDDWTDVTSTKTSGSASASGDVVTTPQIKDLVKGHTYRCEVAFTCNTNKYECYFELVCTK